MQRRLSSEQSSRHPEGCAIGNLYRFLEPVVLLMLKKKGTSYGYSLCEDLANYSISATRVDRSALYRTLRTLERNGYVKSHWYIDRSGPARRVYSLTKEGNEHLREWARTMERVADGMRAFARNAL